MKKKAKKEMIRKATSILGVCLLTVVMVAKANWFSDRFHQVTDAVSHAAQEATEQAKEAAERARQIEQAAAQKAQEEASALASAARAAANVAREKAVEAAEHAKAAEEKAQQAARAEEAHDQALADRAVVATRSIANRALSVAQQAVQIVVLTPVNTIHNAGQTAITMIENLTGHGSNPSVDYLEIYKGAIAKALNQAQLQPGFASTAYQILGALASNADLAMRKHITWAEFEGLVKPYGLAFNDAQWAALQAAFSNGTALPANTITQPNLSSMLISKLLQVIGAQKQQFNAEFQKQFANLPGYLAQHPDVLKNAQLNFIAQIWTGSLSNLKSEGVTTEQFMHALHASGLDQAHMDALHRAFLS